MCKFMKKRVISSIYNRVNVLALSAVLTFIFTVSESTGALSQNRDKELVKKSYDLYCEYSDMKQENEFWRSQQQRNTAEKA